MISSRSASETDPGCHVVESSNIGPLPLVESDDKSSELSYIPPQEHWDYFCRLFGDATESWKAAMDAPQGPISLSDTSIPRSQRLADSAPPMTIVQFKEWAAQTGVEMLLIADLTLWKSRKTWRHEFIVVTLEPCAAFKLRGPDSRLGSFPLVENVKVGLQFRIDRGQRKEPFGSHRAAVDTVELMNHRTVLEKCYPCFSLHLRTDLKGSYTTGFSAMMLMFVTPRVFDVLFCLERASAAFGAEYNLISRNCWHFASFVFQTMVILFRGPFDCEEVDTKGHENAIRRQFYGAKIHTFVLDKRSSPFDLEAMYGVQTDDGLPIHKNPFRSALFFIYAGCLGSLNGYPSVYMAESGALIPYLINCTTLSRELVHSGTASMLEELLDKHLSNCDCSGSAMNEKPEVLAAMVASLCLSGLARDMDDVGMTTASLELSVRYIRSHELGYVGARTAFAYNVFGLVNAKDTHPQGVLSAAALSFFAYLLNSAPSDEEQMITIGTMYKIAMHDPQALRAANGLGSAIKGCFAKMLAMSTQALFGFLTAIVASDSLSQMFVEWGLLEDTLDFLKKTDRTRKRDTTTIPFTNTTTTSIPRDPLPLIFNSIFYFVSLCQTTRGIKTLSRTMGEGIKILMKFTPDRNQVTSYRRAEAKAASLFALIQVTTRAMENHRASHNLAESRNEADGDALLGTHESAPPASSSSQGCRRATLRAQRGRARAARAKEGAETASDIDHNGTNKGNQVLVTREGPAPLASSGPRAYWRAMRRGQKDEGHTSRPSEGTDPIRDVHRNGSRQAKRIRRSRD